MRVLVTGGAGFIGSHLTDAFANRGDPVAVVDDLSAGSAGRLDERVQLYPCSVTDADGLSALIEEFRPELVCHLAAQVDVRTSVTSPGRDAQVNVAGTVNVLEAARTVGARVLLCSSGGALYGRESPAPSPETEAPVPESPYGAAKFSAEQYVGLYNRLHGTRHAILRLANVYGPRQDPAGEGGVVGIFCSRVLAGKPLTIYGDGTQTRDFVYVGDVVTAFLAAADSGAPGMWNVGTGIETSVLELAVVTGKIAGAGIDLEFAPRRLGELSRSVLNVELARRDLGWTAATSLLDGVTAVYRWVESGAPCRAQPSATSRPDRLEAKIVPAPPPGATTPLRPPLIVPAYFHPAVQPREWEMLAERAAQVRLTVLNPASGPGQEPDAAYLPVLDRLRSTGTAVAGYVDTNYARRPATEILGDLRRYIRWYQVSGVFFDRVPTDIKNVAHYAELTRSARQAGVRVVAFNHGAHPVEAYAEHADLLGTFEGPWRSYVGAAVPRWTRSWPAGQFFHLVYSVPLQSFSDAYLMAARRHAGCVYLTDKGGDNPWDRLPGGALRS